MEKKMFEVATEVEFNQQTNNAFLFGTHNVLRGIVVPSFIDIFKDTIATVSIKGKETHLSNKDEWAFAKTPFGFVFAYPKIVGDDQIHYVSKMSHASVETSAIITGYAATIIWLSLVSGLAYDTVSISVETEEQIAGSHQKGMDYYDLNETIIEDGFYFTEKDLTDLYSILD